MHVQIIRGCIENFTKSKVSLKLLTKYSADSMKFLQTVLGAFMAAINYHKKIT